MVDIFVNYRSADARYGAAGTYELLSARFGEGRVFRDCVSMLPGERYPESLRQGLEHVKVLVALVGPEWLAANPRRPRKRLVDNENDWVRLEIRRALQRGIMIVPVLLDGTPPLSAADLPGDIADFARRQAAFVEHRTFGDDVRRLADQIVALVPELLLPDLFETAPSLPPRPLPSMLLRPEYEVVPFTGRTAEMNRLKAWLDAPEPVGGRILTGPGGQGKTRLAAELVREARTRGWTAGFVPDTLPAGVLERSGEFRTPLLLVVDYAEGRTRQLVTLARAIAGRPPEHGPVRILMLARSPGIWQRFLTEERDDRVALMFTDVRADPLLSLVPEPDDRAAEFDRALRAFAAVLPVEASTVERPVAIAAKRYGHALDVHAAALAALLDRSAPAIPAHIDPVLRVLDHERRLWRTTTQPYALPDPHPGRLEEVVTAATLFGAEDLAAAETLLAALPTFDSHGHDIVDRYRRWLAGVYPGPAVLNALRPDRLGEDLAARTLWDRPGLVAAVAPVIGGAQLTRALTVLGRAAPRHPGVREAMSALLAADLPGRVPFAVAVATRAEDPALTGVLSDLADTGEGRDLGFDQIVVDHLPDQTLTLAAFAVVHTRTTLERELAREEPNQETVAWLTHNLSCRLDSVGEHDESLVTASRAVTLYGELVADGEDLGTELAAALNNLAGQYISLGLFEDGIEPAARAVERMRELMRSGTGDRHVLATALATYGTVLRHNGRHAEAVAAADEAVRLLRVPLAEGSDEDRVARRIRLAGGLETLGTVLSDADRHGEALAAIAEAARLYRLLDEEDEDRFRADFVRALDNLSGAHAMLGQWGRGHEVAEEALLRARELVERHGEVHLSRLADVLNNSASALRRLSRHDEALPRILEAAGIFRKLAVSRPGTQLAGLAAALYNLGDCLQETGDPGGARDAYDEAVDIYRKLSDPYPDSFEPSLADVLRELGDLLYEEGDAEDALDTAAEAASIFHRLVRDGRTGLRRKLGSSLYLLGLVRYDLGQYGEAARVHAEAATIWTELMRRGEDADPTLLASAIHHQALSHAADGRHEEAEGCYSRAADLLRALVQDGEDELDELAGVLQNHAVCLSALQRHETALEPIREAVALRRQLLDETPGTRTELAEALNNLADAWNDVGRRAEALAAAREAVGLCARLREDGHPEADELYVCALATLATALGARDLRQAVSELARAMEVVRDSGLEEMRDIVRAALRSLALRTRVRRVWRHVTDEPYP